MHMSLWPDETHALCRLQMVELASKKFVCIVDESKLVNGLGGSKGALTQVHRATSAVADSPPDEHPAI